MNMLRSLWIYCVRMSHLSIVRSSVMVCNYVLLFFLYLKECVIISKLGSTVSCGLTREARLTRHKPIA